MELWAYTCLCGSAFGVCFSLPLGRALLAVSMILAALHLVRERRSPVIPLSGWVGFLFVLILVAVTVLGPFSDRGIPRLRKLLWFAGLPLAATLVNTPQRLAGMLGSFAVGTGVLSLKRCILIPLYARAAMHNGEAADFTGELIRLGSMTDGQTLMLGIIVSTGLILACRSAGRTGSWWVALLGLQGAASLLNYKRGSWFVCTLLVVVLLAVKRKLGLLALLAAVLLSTLAIPSVRFRISGLRDEFGSGGGERWAMWTKVAPSLIRKYPWGIGYRTLTNRMMAKRAPGKIGPNRDHLHSNIVQTLVAGGWAGLTVYLLWMASAMCDAVRLVGRTRDGPESERTNALVLMLMLMGLFLNGLVEYNIGDAELVVMYGIIMGSAAAGLRHNLGGAVADLEPRGLRVVLR